MVRRVQEYIESEGGSSGTALLARFGGPPYGYTANVVKACVAGLLRATKVRVQPEGGDEITAIRDAGVRDLFERDRDFRRATIFPAGEDDIGSQSRARICKFFEDRLGSRIDREDDQIANAVVQHFPAARAAAPRRPGPPQPASRLSAGASRRSTGSARPWRSACGTPGRPSRPCRRSRATSTPCRTACPPCSSTARS